MKTCKICEKKVEVSKYISWGADIDETGQEHYYHFDCKFEEIICSQCKKIL